MHIRKVEALVALGMLLVAGFVFYASRGFPELDLARGGSPAAYPRLLAGVFGVSAILLLLESRGREKVGEFIFPDKRKLLDLFFIILFLAVTPYMLMILGFPLTAFLLLIIFMFKFSDPDRRWTARRMLTVTLVSVAITFVVYAVFWWVARILFPRGILWGG